MTHARPHEYLRVEWQQVQADFPTVLYHELDADQRIETRRIEVFRDGWIGGCLVQPDVVRVPRDREAKESESLAVQIAFPPLEEIDSEPGISAAEISQPEFERLWSAATLADGCGS